MSLPTKRKGHPVESIAAAKVRKQSTQDRDVVFSDREMENVLSKLPNELLLRAVKDNFRLVPIAHRFIRPRYLDQSFKTSNKMEPQSIEFLNLFGMVIRSLRLVYDEDEDYHRFDPEIEKIIFDCCMGLYEICLVNANRLSMFNIAKPFESVTTVSLESGTFSTALSRVGKWFPKLQKLKLIDVRLPCKEANRFFGHERCPHLQYLQIRNLTSADDGSGNAYMKDISALVKNSPELGTIVIDRQDNIDELLKMITSMNSNLPNLRLELDSHSKKSVGASRIHFKSLKSLNFLRFDHPIKISTDKVEEISVHCKCFDENWLKLFKDNAKTAHSIDVFADKWMNEKITSEFVDLVKAMHGLQKMNMWARLSTAQVVDLVSNGRSFQHGKFVLSDEQNNKSMKDSLRSNWSCKCYSRDLYYIERLKKRTKLKLTSTIDDSTSEDSSSDETSTEDSSSE